MKRMMALVAILILMVGGAAVAAPPAGNQTGREVPSGGPTTIQENQTGREAPGPGTGPVSDASPAPAAPVYMPVPGAPGGPGPRGLPGRKGNPGPPPTDQQVEKVVDKVLAAMDGEPVPASYTPILEAAKVAGLVVGYPGGEYRWARRASRAEVVLIVTRFRDDLETKLGKKIEDLDTEIQILAGTDARHDRQIRVLMAETRDLREEGETREARTQRFVLWIALIILAGVIARTEPQF